MEDGVQVNAYVSADDTVRVSSLMELPPLRRRTYPGGTQASKDTLAYDADHRLTYHRVTVDGSVQWTDGPSYDYRGKVTDGGMTYTGLGYLEDPGNFQWGLAGEALNWESFVTDGLGQIITRGGQDFFTQLPFQKTYYTNVDGDVYQIVEDWSFDRRLGSHELGG